MDHCLCSKHYVNVVIAGKHPSPQWLPMDEAVIHCTKVLASGPGQAPITMRTDLVMACWGMCPRGNPCRGVHTKTRLPELKIRVVNSRPRNCNLSQNTHGLCGKDFDFHNKQTGDHGVSCLSLNSSPPHLSPQEPRQYSRAGL
jgi:xylulose-5-phosphate/fructose-6-phosphate phosphoketolase